MKATLAEKQKTDYEGEAFLLSRVARSKAFLELERELAQATNNFGKFASFHEGFAILKEEVDELWDEVKASKPPSFFSEGLYSWTPQNKKLRAEAVQVAAMAMRFILDLTVEPFRDAEGSPTTGDVPVVDVR